MVSVDGVQMYNVLSRVTDGLYEGTKLPAAS